MLIKIRRRLFILLSFLFLLIMQLTILKTKTPHIHIQNTKMNKHILSFDNSKGLETKIECVGPLYNQSCLYKNLYYVNNTFMILTVKGRHLPLYSVRTDAFMLQAITPEKLQFDTYSLLEKFVRNIVNPEIFPSVTVYFGQIWHNNIGHALFDGLYPAYIALIRFPPRHLHPFRLFVDIDPCDNCWSEDVYSRFAGLGIFKQSILSPMSTKKWFMFDELIMGSGNLCQRCIQSNLQLPGGVTLDASRLFRDRTYKQYDLIPSFVRKKSSSEGRTPTDVLFGCIIANIRFSAHDLKQINEAIFEINNYTDFYLNQIVNNRTKLEWPLIRLTFINYEQIKADKNISIEINATKDQLMDDRFRNQLKLVHQMDIHVSAPGTAQMYQTFLSDGSVSINLGGLRQWRSENASEPYTSYLEQYVTSGTPYIKGLYYPINERRKGIKKEIVIQLIRQAGQMILQGFSLPVNPHENLATDGQLFVELCQLDREFCSFITERSWGKDLACLDFWVEDLVHEDFQWKIGGFIRGDRNVSCPFNRSLLRQLRDKYQIKL